MSDPWRKRCPNGHTSWNYWPTEDRYHCHYCGDFEKPIDWKTKEPVTLDV